MTTEATAEHLMQKHHELSRQLRGTPDNPQIRERLRSVTEKLREILATPPAGYTLHRLSWHSRGCPPGRLRLYGVTATTPDHPTWHDGPSLRAIREVITAHPATPTPAED